MTAFALSAPLFNPLSLLYGLTLSRPYVIVGFACASLVVVTILGMAWDRLGAKETREAEDETTGVIGVKRLWAAFDYMSRELSGVTGALALVAILGVVLLGACFPHGALQTSVEQNDPLAPVRMALVAVPIYATPMQTIGQLGMMFAHANSPGAAFCLLILGTGINLGTLAWLMTNYPWRSVATWFLTLMVVVVGLAYALDKPLIPPGVEPAGHTHAFDVYTNPFSSHATWHGTKQMLQDSVGLADRISFGLAALVFALGGLLRLVNPRPSWQVTVPGKAETTVTVGRFDRVVPPITVGITAMVGLVALSVVACYAYYPHPAETLEEMRMARVDALSAAKTGNVDEALRWMEVWDDWSRRLEVGWAIRHFELRPYQQMQGFILRKKLELLEHELEHETLDKEEIEALIFELSETSRRLRGAFTLDSEKSL